MALLITAVCLGAASLAEAVITLGDTATTPQADLVSLFQRSIHARRGEMDFGYSNVYLKDGHEVYELHGPDLNISIEVDATTGTIRISSASDVLDDAKRLALKGIEDEASLEVSTATLALTGRNIVRSATMICNLAKYLASAPEGLSLANLTITSNGVMCLAPGSMAKAKWTNEDGTLKTWQVEVGKEKDYKGADGDYGCMGLCGAGCSGLYYTQDCLNHDECSFKYHADQTNLRFKDPDCGDEWIAAMDDFIFGCDTIV